MTFTIVEPQVPAPEGSADAARFAGSIDVRNVVENEPFGTGDELSFLAEELLPQWSDPAEPKRLLVAELDGRVVARGFFETRSAPDWPVGYVSVQVLPEARGLGIGGALLERIEAGARAEGRTRLLAWVAVPPLGGPSLPSPTGFGSVPEAAASTGFLLRRGWRLEQVERASRYPLPDGLGDLEQRVAEALERSGGDYRVRAWAGRTPPERREHLAALYTRMTTDAPSAGLEDPEDVWTVERLIEAEETDMASPRTTLTAVVEHVPSGALVGYNQLSMPAERHRPVHQEDTLVIREHRGHRLGMLLKVANLLELQRREPGHPGVLTYNAEENRPMLDVNEALGFVPIGYEGAWRKDLN